MIERDNNMPHKKIKRNRKSVWHYFRIYFISLFVSLVIFGVGSFFKPQFNCANSITCKSDLTVNVDNDTIGIFQGRQLNLWSEILHNQHISKRAMASPNISHGKTPNPCLLSAIARIVLL